jgi:hypothetical protein
MLWKPKEARILKNFNVQNEECHNYVIIAYVIYIYKVLYFHLFLTPPTPEVLSFPLETEWDQSLHCYMKHINAKLFMFIFINKNKIDASISIYFPSSRKVKLLS